MPKSTTRSSADEIRTAIATTIRNNFDYRNVRGLTENPTVTQNPTRQTQEPYIYVYSVGQVEIDSTKDDTPFQYHVAIEVTLRYNSYRGGQRQGEEIMNEVFAYVRGKNSSEYPDLSAYGFNVYNTTTGDTAEFTDRLRGANYYKVITALYVTASFTGQEVQVQPIQAPDYTYSGFSYLPISNNIERYDAGNIIPAQTYTSPNNGWTFDNVNYSLTPTAQGSYDPRTRFELSGAQATAKFSGIVVETPNTDASGADSPTGNAIDGGNAGRWSIFFGNQTGQTQPGWFITPTATRFFCNFTVGDTSVTIEDIVNTFVDNYTNAYNGGTVTTLGDITKIATNAFTWAPDTGSVASITLIANSIANTSTVTSNSNYVIETTNEPVALDSTIDYVLENDDSITTSLTASTAWNRIDSIRYGAIPASAGQQPTFSDDSAATYGLRLLSNWNIEYGTTDPQNQTITLSANKDEYLYIIVSVNEVLAGIRDSLGTNNINNFDVVTDGQYRYYITKLPVVFDNSTFTYTLNT